MHVVTAVIGIGWIVFWIGWLAAAVTAKSSRGGWTWYGSLRTPLIAVIAVLVWQATRGRAGGPHVTVGPVLAGIGLALWVAGLALAVWARLYIGRNWGMPMSRREEPGLVTTGPYRFIRHPIYTGIIAAVVGTGLAITVWALIGVALLTGFFVFSAYREEGFLVKEFPDSYPGYRARTKMLVPFLF